MFSYPVKLTLIFQEKELNDMQFDLVWKDALISIYTKIKSVFLSQAARTGVQFYVGLEDDGAE